MEFGGSSLRTPSPLANVFSLYFDPSDPDNSRTHVPSFVSANPLLISVGLFVSSNVSIISSGYFGISVVVTKLMMEGTDEPAVLIKVKAKSRGCVVKHALKC